MLSCDGVLSRLMTRLLIPGTAASSGLGLPAPSAGGELRSSSLAQASVRHIGDEGRPKDILVLIHLDAGQREH